MFTKLNRVLLVSGLAVASAALLSPSAFGQATTDNEPVTVTGNVQPLTDIVVTPGGNTFDVSFNTAVVDQQVATVAYKTNVIGNWKITAEGDSATPGTLETPDTNAVIPYTIGIQGGAGAAGPQQPGPLGNGSLLASDTVANTVLEQVAVPLVVNITAAHTKVPTAPTSAYSEIVTLVFTSDL